MDVKSGSSVMWLWLILFGVLIIALVSAIGFVVALRILASRHTRPLPPPG